MNSKSRKLWAQHLSGQGRKSQSVDPVALLKKTPYAGRILGIDPSLRGTGLAVLECQGNRYKLLHSETLKLTAKVASIDCLGKIYFSFRSKFPSTDISNINGKWSEAS